MPVNTMFCKKCGRPTEDNGIICSECAAMEKRPAEDYFEEMPAIEPVFSAEPREEVPADFFETAPSFAPADTFELNTEGTIKPAKKPVGLIIGAVAGLVAVIAAFLFFNWDKFFKPYDTPEEHLAYVESESAKDTVDSATSLYGGLLNTLNGSNKMSGGTSMQMHVKLSDDAIDMLSSFADVDIDWANDILINLDTASSGKKLKAAIGLGLENTTIATADVIMDFEELMMYLGIPELSGTYLEIDMEDLIDNVYGGSTSYMEDAYVSYASYSAPAMDWDDYSELVEALPTEQELNKILKKYIAVAFDAIGEVDSSAETITVDGVSQKCTALTITVDQEAMYNIVFEILNTAKEDKELINMILSVANCDCVDADLDENDITDAIEEAIEEMEDAKDEVDEDEVLFELTDYVDSDENIIGRRIEIEDMDDIYYLMATNNGKFAFEASVGDVEITGSGTNKKSIMDGEYVLEVEGEEILIIELEKFNVKSWNSGNAVGTIRIKPSEEMAQQIMSEVAGVGVPMDIALEMVFNNNSTKKHMEFNVLLDDDFFAGITIDATKNSNSKVTIPKDTVDITDGDELMEWAEDLDFDALIDNMEDAGIPKEYIRQIEKALG